MQWCIEATTCMHGCPRHHAHELQTGYVHDIAGPRIVAADLLHVYPWHRLQWQTHAVADPMVSRCPFHVLGGLPRHLEDCSNMWVDRAQMQGLVAGHLLQAGQQHNQASSPGSWLQVQKSRFGCLQLQWHCSVSTSCLQDCKGRSNLHTCTQANMLRCKILWACLSSQCCMHR